MNNRYTNISADINIQRSKVHIPHTNLTTLNVGELHPIYMEEVLPGSSVSGSVEALLRALTPLNPVFSKAYLDVYFFYVPYRQVWNHWKQFLGENDSSAWTSNIKYKIPTIPIGGKDKSWLYALNREDDSYSNQLDLELVRNDTIYTVSCGNSVGDALGIPIANILNQEVDADISGVEVSSLPLRSYVHIWNEWFRDTISTPPILFSKDDLDFFSDSQFDLFGYTANKLQVCKFKDMFTSALPEPQFGEGVKFLDDFLPVFAVNQSINETINNYPTDLVDVMTFVDTDNPSTIITGSVGIDHNGLVSKQDSNYTGDVNLSPDNLVAYTGAATLRTINSLRIAFATQKLFEAKAIGGQRYRDILKAVYGVSIDDGLVQIPELLCGERILINMQQVLSTTDNDRAALGTTGAFSNTYMKKYLLNKSFQEHGLLMGLCCIRTEQVYSQGLDEVWTRLTPEDFYYPQFANIGYQPIEQKRLYLSGIDTEDKKVFGYQEAWARYREKPNIATCFMNPNYPGSFGQTWTYVNKFYSAPTLSQEFISQDLNTFNRTVAVSNILSPQFYGEFYFPFDWTLPMPVYSTPGLRSL